MSTQSKVGPTFYYIPPSSVAAMRQVDHVDYLQQIGLSEFVSGVFWDTRNHSEVDMIEFIGNFDAERLETFVKGQSINLSMDSIKNMFGLQGCGPQVVEQKTFSYTPASFQGKRNGNGSYSLNCCKDPLIRERLEFQMGALHIRGMNRGEVPTCQIKQVEESASGKNWGDYFGNRLMEVLGKVKEQLLGNKTFICNCGSHLQVILSKHMVALPREKIPTQEQCQQAEDCVVGKAQDCEAKHSEMSTTTVNDSQTTKKTIHANREENLTNADGLHSRLQSQEVMTHSHIEGEQMTIPYCTTCSTLEADLNKLRQEQEMEMQETQKIKSILSQLLCDMDQLKHKYESLATKFVSHELLQNRASLLPLVETPTDQAPYEIMGNSGRGMKRQAQENRVVEGSIAIEQRCVLEPIGLPCVNGESSDTVLILQSKQITNAPFQTPLPSLTKFKSKESDAQGNESGCHAEEIQEEMPKEDNNSKRMRLRQCTLFPEKLSQSIVPITGKRKESKLGRRENLKWTAEEIECLTAGVSRYPKGKWHLIKQEYAKTLQDRTVVDLKDKWRNMHKSTEDE